MTLTKKIIYAAAMDQYASAKRKGLSQDQANDAYQNEFDRLFVTVGGVEAWIDLR